MNNKPLIIVVGSGVGLFLGLLALIVILGRDPAAYIGALTQLAAFILGTGVLTKLITKNNEDTATTKHQTNGTLSKLLEANEALHQENKALREASAANPTVNGALGLQSTIPGPDNG